MMRTPTLARSAALVSDERAQRSGVSIPLTIILLYFIVEYGKPSFLAPLKPGLIILTISLLYLVFNIDKMKVAFNDSFFKLVALLLVLMAIHVPIAPNNRWALWFFVGMVTIGVFSLVLFIFVDSFSKLRLVLACLIGIFALCAVAQLTASRDYFGASGFLGDMNDFALAMNVAIPIAFYLGLSTKGCRRFLCWSMTSLFIVANVSTGSRGGFIGMAAVALACWLKSKYRIRSLTGMLLIVSIFAIAIPDTYRARLSSITEEGADKGTGKARVEMWKVGWRLFLAHPIIGVGQGNIPWTIEQYQTFDEGESQRGLGGRVTHSVYFTLLPELGIIGAAIWFSILLNAFSKYKQLGNSPARQATKDEVINDSECRILYQGVGIALFGYLVTGAFLSALYYPYFWHLCVLLSAAYRMRCNEKQPVVKQRRLGYAPAVRGRQSNTDGVYAPRETVLPALPLTK